MFIHAVYNAGMFSIPARKETGLPDSLPTFTQQINEAFRKYRSVLTLAQIPLAHSPLIRAALVPNDLAPTTAERGRAVQLILRWAVEQIAPGQVNYPIGTERPFDDPTWLDPLWWRYNILRHRYIEPLHPDRFIEGGRHTQTLLTLTGIPTKDTFYEQRNRAIKEIATFIYSHLGDASNQRTLREKALTHALKPLLPRQQTYHLLEIAAVFFDTVALPFLRTLAREEKIDQPERKIAYLLQHRFLDAGDLEDELLMPASLRDYVNRRTAETHRMRWHRRLTSLYQEKNESFVAARHALTCGNFTTAAELILEVVGTLGQELDYGELVEMLESLQEKDLTASQGIAIQQYLSDIYLKMGNWDKAVAVAREALQIEVENPEEQAMLYLRLGKLYEKRDRELSLSYYAQAEELFNDGDPAYCGLLKDRAWIYILGQEWSRAAADLERAQELVAADDYTLKADLLEAEAIFFSQQGQFQQAVENARQALLVREKIGAPLKIASCLGNLAVIYTDKGDFETAVNVYEEILDTYRKLGHEELITTTLNNLGAAYHFAGNLDKAVYYYELCLTRSQLASQRMEVVRARGNLAEALAELGHEAAAAQHWRIGYSLATRMRSKKDLSFYDGLLEQYPQLQALVSAVDENAPPTRLIDELDPASRIALDLAKKQGRLKNAQFMAAANISKATATRRLTDLVDRGLLQRHGQKRGTYYTLAETEVPSRSQRGDWLFGEKEPLLQQISETIESHYVLLQSQFGVRNLDYSADSVYRSERGIHLSLEVSFNQLPGLHSFFDLEKELSKLLNVHVDLQAAMPER